MLRSLVAWLTLASASASATCLTPAEAEAAAGAGPMEKLSPPIPMTWPPSGAVEVRYFDFHAEPLPTGIVSYSIQSPSTEIVVPLGGEPVRRAALGKRTKLGDWMLPSQRHAPPSALLLQLVCEGRAPTEAEAILLREGYGAWLKDEPLVRDWLRTRATPFITWLSQRPLPPPAPPGSKLTARLDGEAIVLTREGKDVRLSRPGASAAQLTVVPLRADGSEPALWVNLTDPARGAIGLLVRYASPPQTIYTHAYSSNQFGIGTTSRSLWLLDVDGDGWNDAVEHSSFFSDVGRQPAGTSVFRFDPATGDFVPGDRALQKRAPVASTQDDRAGWRKIGDALHVPSVDSRGQLDLHAVPLNAAPRPDSLGAGDPPFVGPDVMRLVLVRKKGQALGGQYHLAHVRFGPQPSVIMTIDLGPVGFPPNGCNGRHEEFRREPGAIVIVWPASADSLVEQRVPWDGTTLSAPTAPPRQIASCGL